RPAARHAPRNRGVEGEDLMIAELRSAAASLEDLATLLEQKQGTRVATLNASRLLRAAAMAAAKLAAPPVPPMLLRLTARLLLAQESLTEEALGTSAQFVAPDELQELARELCAVADELEAVPA